MELNYTNSQRLAVDKINAGENVFLTGGGGVGKSYVIQNITDRHTLLCAPTGVAALNIGGVTCHSLFGLPIGLPRKVDAVDIPPWLRKRFDRYSGVKRIIIDEVSMVRSDYLDLIDQKLKKIRGNSNPFGGIQMVVVGDFFQLPPIVSESERDIFYERYNTPFAFGAKCWEFHTQELVEPMRQSDIEQIEILNDIRKAHNLEHSIQRLKEISQHTSEMVEGGKSLMLCSYNRDADIINRVEYKKIKGNQHTYIAHIVGGWKDSEMPVSDCIDLKVGASVMVCSNIPEQRLVNGDTGVVTDLYENEVVISTSKGLHLVSPVSWEKYAYTRKDGCVEKTVKGLYRQIPLKYGWAVSIHKSQGMTLDNVTIDVGAGCFSHGQLYVALSRCKDLRNVSFLKDLSVEDVLVEEEVVEFYSNC